VLPLDKQNALQLTNILIVRCRYSWETQSPTSFLSDRDLCSRWLHCMFTVTTLYVRGGYIFLFLTCPKIKHRHGSVLVNGKPIKLRYIFAIQGRCTAQIGS